MRGILIDVNKKSAEVMDIEDTLDTYYKLLDCNCISIVNRSICGNDYAIVCDDEGFFVDKPIISAIYKSDSKYALVGNLFIANYGTDGELTDLSDKDIKKVLSRYVVAASAECAFLILD